MTNTMKSKAPEPPALDLDQFEGHTPEYAPTILLVEDGEEGRGGGDKAGVCLCLMKIQFIRHDNNRNNVTRSDYQEQERIGRALYTRDSELRTEAKQ